MKSYAYAFISVALSVFAGCSGESRTPTSFDPTTAPQSMQLETAARSDQSARAGSGLVVHALNGGPLAGVRLEIGDESAVTAADGSFTLPDTGLTPLPAVLTATSFHPRETRLSTTSLERATIDLLPMDEKFDLQFFDHVFRDVGESHTRRWTEEPEFVLWTKVVDCRPGELGDCSDLFVTEQDAPGQFLQMARNVIAADTPKFTGGVLRGNQIATFTPVVGKTYTFREYMLAGQIPVTLTRGYENDTSFARPWPWRSGRMYSGSIQMHVRHKAIPFVYSHELAHTLGYRHPLGYRNVPRPSVMRTYQDRPTSWDILHGRILYRRPPGSRSPDIDPVDFTVNAARVDGDSLPDPGLIEQLH